MTNMEDVIWFAVSVITRLALNTDNTVADTAEKLGAESIAELIEFRAALPAHFYDDSELIPLKAASYAIDHGAYEYEDMSELRIVNDSVNALKRACSLSDPIDELAEELYDILITGRYKEEAEYDVELSPEIRRSRFFRAAMDYAYTKEYNRYMNEHIADIPRVMPCFAVWSEKVERDARAYADNFSYGWATGFCETARMFACAGSDLSGYTLGDKPLDADILREFVEIARGTAQ